MYDNLFIFCHVIGLFLNEGFDDFVDALFYLHVLGDADGQGDPSDEDEKIGEIRFVPSDKGACKKLSKTHKICIKV